ncbi:hypothetical protein [Ensifer sp. LCM 4579]|uniref:hypothetical protein n=1 Tax=Ensifer sp. LCM 4579 TaxID=1848292 RepID=UPI001FCD228D|nr:hypothetical protein [Ensifer sp. LCM 4579]
MLTKEGGKVIDFLSGAGALNYGHNHEIKAAITEYLPSDAVVRGLDMATPAKLEFMRPSTPSYFGKAWKQFCFSGARHGGGIRLPKGRDRRGYGTHDI